MNSVELTDFCELMLTGDMKYLRFVDKNSNKLYLLRKFKSFLKLKNLIKLDKQINDIVDASMKIEG